MSNLLKNSIIDIINNYSEFFLNKNNVHGIALGHKFIKGIDTKEPCLTVFVENKHLENNMYSYDMVPKKFLNIKTDVIKNSIPKISIAPLTIPTGNPEKDKEIQMLQKLKRPLQAGYSIQPLNRASFGTIGAIVFDNDTNEPYILSNNHVLAGVNEKDLGESIMQSNEIVANLHKQVILKGGDKFNIMDCATAKILKNIPYTTDIYKIGKINGTDEVEVDTEVKKLGARTGYTTGTVAYTNATQIIDFSSKNLGTATFREVILCTQMSDRGDSGSLVVDSNNNAIGLIFAGTNYSCINPITPIKKVLNIHF